MISKSVMRRLAHQLPPETPDMRADDSIMPAGVQQSSCPQPMVHFTVPGEPQGKGRARVYNGHGVTPEKTVMYENLIVMCYMDARNKAGVQPLPLPRDVPVVLKLEAVYSIPKSTTKGKRAQMESGDLLPVKKPDLDNIVKCFCDALNGHAYADDAQICCLQATKRYTMQGEAAHVAAWVWPLNVLQYRKESS
jgi:Holliday junction resolvase RusA-like endonuclease